jgi:hypothetical protein
LAIEALGLYTAIITHSSGINYCDICWFTSSVEASCRVFNGRFEVYSLSAYQISAEWVVSGLCSTTSSTYTSVLEIFNNANELTYTSTLSGTFSGWSNLIQKP